nr:UDP-N-acetylmuramoyl-L-alanine--D-glutamate ligase [Corynebacterium mendelii]
MVAGAGVSGAGCVRMLCDLGVPVVVADDNEIARQKVHELTGATDISVACAMTRLAEFALVVTSPGWRPDTALLTAAADAGCEVIGDIELAWRLDMAGAFGAPHTWVVITGTNGKTTTTAMCAAMLVAGGKKAAAVGNIGVAVGDALTAATRIDILVAELSSFQLHWTSRFRPDAGALLNLADDHLDWHGSFAAYAAAKARALTGPVAVIGADDPHVAEQVKQLESDGVLASTRLIGFTLNEPTDGELGIHDGYLLDRACGGDGNPDGVVLAAADGISPAGAAGRLDALAAAALARSQGVEPAAVKKALATFTVSAHRGQVVDNTGDIRFIDNSKATNPHAADAAMAGADPFIWIAGGQLKGADIDALVKAHAHHITAAVLLGVDRMIIADCLGRLAPDVPVTVIDSTDPDEAMRQCVAAAIGYARAGDTVMLAPAAASLDMYEGMGQRGDLFAAHARAYTCGTHK